MIQQIRLVLLIPKELWNGQRDQKFWPRKESTYFVHFWPVPEWDIGCLLALVGQYKPPTGFCHKPYEVTMGALNRACHSFTQALRRISKVQQKTCLLGEQRTRAPSILNLSWRIPDKPPRWQVVAESRKDARILGLQRRGIQSRARDEAWSLRAFV